DKNENITRYTYDKVGNIKEVRQPNGALTKYEYDNNYNRIKLTNPRGKITTYTYDRDNRLISETDPLGNTKRYNYNRNNNLTKYISNLGNTTSFEYDTDNNLIKEIDSKNKAKQYTYDKLHRLTKTKSELNNTAEFSYDVVDNVVGIKDPKGTNTVFDYNDVGKVVQERSVDNTIRTYNYDRAGRLISKIDKDYTKIAYDYDANDNLIKKYYLDLNNQQTDDSIIYSYNAENNRLGMNDKSGLSRTLYDNKGNLIVGTSNNDEDIVRYEYDSNDRITKIICPTNATVTYTYDENGNIKTVTDKDGLKTTYTYDENDNEVIRTTGLIETNKRYDADNRLIRIKNEHRFTGELIDEYSYRYDSNNNIIEEIKREPYRKKVSLLDIEKTEENDHTIRVTKQNFTYDDENKLTDARVERLGMKALSEPNVTTYHYEYDANGNRTTVEIKDDGLTLESTVYTYDRLNKLVSSREVTASGLYLYAYTYDDNGNLVSEDRHRQFETQRTNIRRYEYTKDNKLESVYSGNTLLVSYTYDGDGTITSSLERDLDLNQNLNIHDTNYLNSLTNNQRQLINKVPSNDSFLYELTEYITDKNRPYSETLMERDGTGQLSTIYTYGNQRINSESYNNLSGLYTYDGRGSVSAVIGSYGDFRASYWYDGLGNVKSQIHGYGAFGSGKKYYGYNAEQYNPVTGNQNLRNRQVNIRRQRFLTEDTYIGKFTETLSINRYIYGNDNPLKYKDPSGNIIVIDQVSQFISDEYQKFEQSAIKQVGKRATRIITNNNDFANRMFPNKNMYDDILSNDWVYHTFVKPELQRRSDNIINSLDENVFNGGGGVANIIYNSGKSSTVRSVINEAKKYSANIQKCSDYFAKETLDTIDTWTNEFGSLAGFKTITDNNNNKIISTNYWTWQGWGGYTTFYDELFHDFTPTDHDRIQIGNEYTIWLWKGDYLNLGAGGEIGIYNGTGNVVSTTMSDELNIGMTMNITDSSGNSIVNIGKDKNLWDVITGNNPNENWWLTGWNPNKQGLTNEDLIMTGTLDFSQSKDKDLYNNLKNAYYSSLNDFDPTKKTKSKWEFDDKKKTAKFSWEY
ncbi:MAG: DUF4474 domain-containing protein, partial [Lachnospiraceae bacterium]|nr:DUF4474 domain-containing protein [Lachnospiraceae bacterium]